MQDRTPSIATVVEMTTHSRQGRGQQQAWQWVASAACIWIYSCLHVHYVASCSSKHLSIEASLDHMEERFVLMYVSVANLVILSYYLHKHRCIQVIIIYTLTDLASYSTTLYSQANIQTGKISSLSQLLLGNFNNSFCCRSLDQLKEWPTVFISSAPAAAKAEIYEVAYHT